MTKDPIEPIFPAIDSSHGETERERKNEREREMERNIPRGFQSISIDTGRRFFSLTIFTLSLSPHPLTPHGVLTVNIEPRRVARLASAAARDALVLAPVFGLDRRDVHVRYYVPVHGHVLANQESVVLRKRKSIQQPGNLRRRITRRAAFQRNRWTGLHCLFDKPVDQLRRDLC